MAESSAATQSPSVSSSSSGVEPSAPGGGGGSPGACPALGPKSCGSSCAEELSSLCSNELPSEIMSSSFLSSSEISNSNHTTLGERGEVLGSPPAAAKGGKDPLALLDARKMEQPQGTSKDGADSPASLAAGVPSIPSSFPQRPASLPKEAGVIGEQISKDQESKSPSKVASREDRSPLNAGQSKTEGICTYSLSPSEVSGGGAERDSPESPFEVIIDKATFDREFKDSYKESANDMGSWTARSDRESTTDMLETDDKLFPLRSKEAGRYPASVLFARQFSHTTAALEEVSKCVNDMHNFTNEILTWDLVPQVKQQTDKSPDCTTKSTTLDRSECHSEIPVINLKTNTLEKMPVCSGNGSSPIARPLGAWSEASLSQDDVIGKPAREPPSSTEVGAQGVQGRAWKQEDVLSQLPGSLCDRPVSWGSGAATGKALSPDDRLSDGGNWPSSVLGALTEADSSGDSDDTVIEDIATDTSLENNKMEPGEPVPRPSAVAETREREIKEMASCETVGKKTSENSEELASNSEPPRGQPDGRGRSPGGAGGCSQAPETSSTGASEKLTARDSPTLPSAPTSVFTEAEFSPTMTASAVDSSQGKHVNDTGDSSPEDLRAALMETREEAIEDQEGGNVSDTALEKMVGLKSTSPEEVLHERDPGGSESKDTSKYSEHSQAARGSACPSQGSAVASLDLEQEQLTIRALKEIGEEHVEKSASAQGEVRQTFAPQSWPQTSSDFVEHTGEKTGYDLGISKKPTVVQETRVDYMSSLNKTELVNKSILARLLTHFSVRDLIFWRDVKKTGFVFGTTLIVLLSLAAFSVISVVSYLILALLSVTISFRVYKSVIQAVQKSEEGHPFKAYLDVDVTLSSEAFHSYMNAAMVHVNRALKLIIRLFLVEDLVDSLKLAVFMWLMTYVGAVFNGITLLILAELLVFSVPIVYEKYKTQIDHYVGIARDQTKSIVEKIQAKLPGIAKKKAE